MVIYLKRVNLDQLRSKYFFLISYLNITLMDWASDRYDAIHGFEYMTGWLTRLVELKKGDMFTV